jgi:hypothetical protein
MRYKFQRMTLKESHHNQDQNMFTVTQQVVAGVLTAVIIAGLGVAAHALFSSGPARSISHLSHEELVSHVDTACERARRETEEAVPDQSFNSLPELVHIIIVAHPIGESYVNQLRSFTPPPSDTLLYDRLLQLLRQEERLAIEVRRAAEDRNFAHVEKLKAKVRKLEAGRIRIEAELGFSIKCSPATSTG